MDFLDPLILARIQFAATAIFHFMFVPMSVGIGLIVAITETRNFRKPSPQLEAGAKMWVKILGAIFVVGIVTGITMEFAFGANWADYSRFVGAVFGAPLAAEALLAFFLESVFLGILIFGRNKVSRRFYMISAWLTWIGSTLSCLWILVANSWMQTPAGAALGSNGNAIITDFITAAFNPSLPSRFFHTVLSLLVMGSFIAMAISAWYMYKKRHAEFALSNMKLGAVLGTIMTCLLLVSAHASAVVVAQEQPTKLALMEGLYDSDVPPLYLFGYVDEATQQVVAPFSIPGGTSFLANGTWDTEFQGLNDLANSETYGDLNVADLNVNLVFQSYHLMVLLFGLLVVVLALTLIFTFRKGKIQEMKWLQRLLIFSPLIPILAIQTGWMTAEYGRQPWVVYPSTSGPDGIYMLTANGVSQVVSQWEIIITLALFTLVYTLLFIAMIRVVFGFIKKGPVLEAAGGVLDDDSSVSYFETDASKAEAKEAAVLQDENVAAQGSTKRKEGE